MGSISGLESVVIAASLLTFSVGSYFVWPSRWNIPAHLALGFSFAAYLIPIFVLDVLGSYPAYLVRFYAKVVSLGAVTYLAGLLLGSKIRLERIIPVRFGFDSLSHDIYARLVSRRTLLLLGLGLAAMAACFVWMGFLPMFADDPLAAKFFRGPYRWQSKTLAAAYRFSYYMVVTLIPVTFAAWYVTRRKRHLLAALMGVAAMALALTRGPVVGGFLLFLGLVAAPKRYGFRAYLIFVLLIYPFGAASYFVFGRVFDIYGLFGYYKTDTLWDIIASGSPDVAEHLNFLGSYLSYGDFTHGRTFWGGLIPGNYSWNPAVWTLTLNAGGLNRADVTEVISGGLRLPVAIWGYTAFGWIGDVVVSFLSGCIWGVGTTFTKRRVERGYLILSIVMLTLYQTLWAQLASFYVLSIYSIPSILVALSLAYSGRLTHRTESARAADSAGVPDGREHLLTRGT